MKTHGDAGWESYPSYLDIIAPRAVEFLGERGLNITFFIVGRDASLEKNHSALQTIAAAGHEIGNHSFDHEPWLHLYSRNEIVDEFERTEMALHVATGKVPTGFRGPGYSLSPTVLEVLSERGYEYDCSTLPTYIGPFARLYYFLRSPKMSDAEKAKRKKLFGTFSDGMQTLKPHVLNIGGRQLVELPVTTFPVIKAPIHASYVIYLATFSRTLAMAYWRSALTMCRLTGTEPSLLLHPLDLMCGEEVPELKFFPAMDLPLDKKLEILDEILALYSANFTVVNMRSHAANVLSRKTADGTATSSSVKTAIRRESV
jgi:hypothetical protein